MRCDFRAAVSDSIRRRHVSRVICVTCHLCHVSSVSRVICVTCHLCNALEAFIVGVFSYIDHMMVDGDGCRGCGLTLGNAMGDGGIDPAMDAVTLSRLHFPGRYKLSD